jgi:hypothetical protein
MAFVKNSARSGKKAPAAPGPNGAGQKNIAATNKAKSAGTALTAGKGHGLGKPGKKELRPGLPYSSLRSRQMLLEKLRRQIWASVADINGAIVQAALAGNLQAAKALFDFAGVYSLPEPQDEAAAAATPVKAATEPDGVQAQEPVIAEDVDPVDAYFRSIGMTAVEEERELEVKMG